MKVKLFENFETPRSFNVINRPNRIEVFTEEKYKSKLGVYGNQILSPIGFYDIKETIENKMPFVIISLWEDRKKEKDNKLLIEEVAVTLLNSKIKFAIQEGIMFIDDNVGDMKKKVSEQNIFITKPKEMRDIDFLKMIRSIVESYNKKSFIYGFTKNRDGIFLWNKNNKTMKIGKSIVYESDQLTEELTQWFSIEGIKYIFM